MTRITQQQTESYLWGAAVLLRGTVDGGLQALIFPQLFYKRKCDVFDEAVLVGLRESGENEDIALGPEFLRK